MAPPHNDGLRRKCGQPRHLALNCRPGQPHNASRPPVGRKKGRRTHHTGSCSAGPPAMSVGQVTHVKIEEAHESPKIVMGTLRVNSVPTYVLFDSGA